MADLKQALIWLAEGKKVTCTKFWRDHEYMYLSGDLILNQDHEIDKGHLYLITNSWELYEEPNKEPKALSDCTGTAEKMQYLKTLLMPNRVYTTTVHYEVLKTIESVLIDLTSKPIPSEYGSSGILSGYRKPPEYDPREAQLTNSLEDMAEYIVWDKNGRRTFAFWDATDKAFYDIHGYAFSLEVKTWKRLPGELDK